MFEKFDKKLIVFVFSGRFVSYCPQFVVLVLFTNPITVGTCLKGMTKNSPFLRFIGTFMSYCP
jgi:hypothetical protein